MVTYSLVYKRDEALVAIRGYRSLSAAIRAAIEWNSIMTDPINQVKPSIEFDESAKSGEGETNED